MVVLQTRMSKASARKLNDYLSSLKFLCQPTYLDSRRPGGPFAGASRSRRYLGIAGAGGHALFAIGLFVAFTHQLLRDSHLAVHRPFLHAPADILGRFTQTVISAVLDETSGARTSPSIFSAASKISSFRALASWLRFGVTLVGFIRFVF